MCQTPIPVKILIASRKEPDIEIWFKPRKTPVIKVEAKKVDSDIKAFIVDEIERRINEGALKLQKSNQILKDKVIDNLSNKAKGM